MSAGSLDDEIWTLNMMALPAAEATRWPGRWSEDNYPFLQVMMNLLLEQSNERLFMRVNIRELTFDGVDSPLLHMGDYDGELGNIFDEIFPSDRFAWFYSVSII